MLTTLLLLALQLPSCEWCGVLEAPPNITSSVTIAPATERGERMVLSGRVLKADRTPAAGVILYAYHTNVAGIYPRRGSETGNARRHGYLRGWVKTDAQGRYRIESIRPGNYPTGRFAAHVHVVVGEPGKAEYTVPDFEFAGDPYLGDRGGEGVVTLVRRNGVWYATRDIVLKP
jgi:protocatechuate 3,4-dioxygenase, beta subunit